MSAASVSTLPYPRRNGNANHAPRFRVALVSMPFASLTSPSIQVGLLKRVAERAGFGADACYPGFELARRIGPHLYQAIADPNPKIHRERFVTFGEWLFSKAAFGEQAPDRDNGLLKEFSEDVDALLTDARTRASDRRLRFAPRDLVARPAMPETNSVELGPESLVHIRDEVIPEYLAELLRSHPWDSVPVVGFTSTFEQNVASFAFGRLLKEAYPAVKLVFGGSNLEGEMGREWFRTMPFIDYIVSGDGEAALIHLLSSLANGEEPEPQDGLITRKQHRDGCELPRTVLRDLDSLPVPDYGDFYRSAAESGFFGNGSGLEASITFETSRGCWWGERRHCTFCGLNGLGMSFRAKSGGRALSELAELRAQYEASPLGTVQASPPLFFGADNIVPMQYFDDFFPALRDAHGPFPIFYEVKANLSRERIQLLHEAGVTVIQPGVESLSTHVLQLMKKGIRAIHNVNCLRWARHHRLLTAWNIIYGFPGETPEDYAEQLDLIPLLQHLQPPQVCGRVRMDRFSPLFDDSASYPTTHRAPMQVYGYTYPRRVRLERTAYFFEHEFVGGMPEEAYAPVRDAVSDWERAWGFSDPTGRTRPPAMTFETHSGRLEIHDMRVPGEHREEVIENQLTARIYAACSDKPLTARAMSEHFGCNSSGPVHGICEELAARGMMMRDGDLFLSLALPANRPH